MQKYVNSGIETFVNNRYYVYNICNFTDVTRFLCNYN